MTSPFGNSTSGALLEHKLDALLPAVSRSFYLSLRLLNHETRPLIALNYLMARAADTIADTAALSPDRRLESLRRFKERLTKASGWRLGDFLGQVDIPEEAELLSQLDLIWQLYDGLEDTAKALSREVLTVILSGMELDLERFPAERSGAMACLESHAELIDYTDRVAGVVGDFWTRAHGHGFPEALGAWAQDPQTLTRAREFGRSLQLINILKDLPKDLRIGRCYIPRERLVSEGLTPEQLLEPGASERFHGIWLQYLELAADKAQQGWRYTLSVPDGFARLRLSCALPLLIGMATLGTLRQVGALDSQVRRKIRRSQLGALAVGYLCRGLSRRALHGYWRGLCFRAGFKCRRRSPS